MRGLDQKVGNKHTDPNWGNIAIFIGILIAVVLFAWVIL
jgi:hypothetical protein